MADTGAGTPTPPRVPGSAWLLGWACLAAQVVSFAGRGATDAESAFVSVPLNALVVAWVSYGVLRARMVRTWLAGIIIGLVSLLALIELVVSPSVVVFAHAATSAVALAAFVAYLRSECFAHFRAQPDGGGPDLAGLVTLAVVVGALGGLTVDDPGPGEGDSGFHVRIGL